jgi:hypothetical protein
MMKLQAHAVDIERYRRQQKEMLAFLFVKK